MPAAAPDNAGEHLVGEVLRLGRVAGEQTAEGDDAVDLSRVDGSDPSVLELLQRHAGNRPPHTASSIVHLVGTESSS